MQCPAVQRGCLARSVRPTIVHRTRRQPTVLSSLPGAKKECGPLQTSTALAWTVLKHRLQQVGQAAVGAAAAAVLLVGAPAQADAETIPIPVSPTPEIFSLQKTLVEVWTIVSSTFVDPTFNHQDWTAVLKENLTQVSLSDSPAAAAKQVSALVASLGDPYTRWVPASEYQEFRVTSDGELKGGVGLLIASDPSSGRLVVLAPIKGSPADRAGIQPGDEVLMVDGTSTKGWDGEDAARSLRGQQGSSVWVRVGRRRPADEVPGVPAALHPLKLPVEYKQYRLRRERVELSPVFATALNFDEHIFGYVRLVNFSQHAADDMRAAITQLQRDGAESFILDLRNNPGGLVKTSMEIASLWMDGEARPTVFSIQDREDAAAMDVASGEGALPVEGPHGVQRVVLNSGRALTQAPLVVLVNEQSASASEILAGALRDNRRAEVVGDPTFGKGKIQSVYELSDGSAVFVTVAKYVTPNGSLIDKVGVRPDRSCLPLGVRPSSAASVPGIPVGPGASDRVMAELSTDSCVLTAEILLEAKSDAAAPPALVAARPSA